MLACEPIHVDNNVAMVRDFTSLCHAVEGLVRLLDNPDSSEPAFDPAQPDPPASRVAHRLFNIGNPGLIPLIAYIEMLEKDPGSTAPNLCLPMCPGDGFARKPISLRCRLERASGALLFASPRQPACAVAPPFSPSKSNGERPPESGDAHRSAASRSRKCAAFCVAPPGRLPQAIDRARRWPRGRKLISRMR